jgi:hypothetical protein
MNFKYGDKAYHDKYGDGTVLNTFPHINLVQFWPDRHRPNGESVDVHPVSLTKVYSAKDMHPDSYYVKDDGGHCTMLDRFDLLEAVKSFQDFHVHMSFVPSLYYKNLDGSSDLLATSDEDGGVSYVVDRNRIDEWFAILPELR